MEVRKWAIVTGILLIGVITGNFAQSSGRSSKVLEDPIVPHTWSSHDSALQSTDRSMSVERNMMLYRTVFTISLKLLTIFFIIKLFGGTISAYRPHQMGWGQQQMGWGQQPMGWGQQGWGSASNTPGGGNGDGNGSGGNGEGGNGNGNGGSGGNGGGNGSNGGSGGNAGAIVTATSFGAAAGASTGGAAGVVGLANGVPHHGFLAAGNSPRPHYLPPGGPPRYRFGLRFPPFRQSPPHMMMPHPNMDTLIETHSNVFIHPDGTQSRVPMTGPIVSHVKPAAAAPAAPSPPKDTQAKSPATETAAESRPVETDVSTSSSSSSSPVAERRTSLAYREKLQQLQQAYEDWNLHFNPGTRSL